MLVKQRSPPLAPPPARMAPPPPVFSPFRLFLQNQFVHKSVEASCESSMQEMKGRESENQRKKLKQELQELQAEEEELSTGDIDHY